MQKWFVKFLLIIISVCFQAFDIQAQNQIAQKADSLFSAKNYSEASKIYELLFTDKSVNKANISLKLAYIFEQMGDYPKTLFYLNTYYNLKPDDEIFEKMNKIALENKYFGFERDDINFILMLYQQYYLFILLVLVLIGAWILFILLRKKQKNQEINKRHLITVSIYLLFLIAMINGPNSYQSGIINKKTYLRELPSAAAPIIGQIELGNKINIFGKEDIWYRIFINKKVAYVNKFDLWIIGN